MQGFSQFDNLESLRFVGFEIEELLESLANKQPSCKEQLETI
jgi:hypothetical protein